MLLAVGDEPQGREGEGFGDAIARFDQGLTQDELGDLPAVGRQPYHQRHDRPAAAPIDQPGVGVAGSEEASLLERRRP
ncbi:hypothetical protein [Methylobacterium nodulans]|uniref:Uncharacterized protein n=1 Tax=Methylobacterium nodulans (strain LMG 21967 / CNCM I-2342 / ORS 2060) TaxID=460265 RepID=B8IVU2_METNO|nr:hypothetical protein Mnod_8412 [Methylobacterium nodulans ORS 2060]